MTPPPSFYVMAAVAAVLPASFLASRDESRHAAAAKGEVSDLRAAGSVSIPDLSDHLYWYIVIAQRHGLRRQYTKSFYSSQPISTLWAGEVPIWHTEQGLWFFHLMTKAERAGLFSEKASPETSSATRSPKRGADNPSLRSSESAADR